MPRHDRTRRGQHRRRRRRRRRHDCRSRRRRSLRCRLRVRKVRQIHCEVGAKLRVHRVSWNTEAGSRAADVDCKQIHHRGPLGLVEDRPDRCGNRLFGRGDGSVIRINLRPLVPVPLARRSSHRVRLDDLSTAAATTFAFTTAAFAACATAAIAACATAAILATLATVGALLLGRLNGHRGRLGRIPRLFRFPCRITFRLRVATPVALAVVLQIPAVRSLMATSLTSRTLRTTTRRTTPFTTHRRAGTTAVWATSLAAAAVHMCSRGIGVGLGGRRPNEPGHRRRVVGPFQLLLQTLHASLRRRLQVLIPPLGQTRDHPARDVRRRRILRRRRKHVEDRIEEDDRHTHRALHVRPVIKLRVVRLDSPVHNLSPKGPARHRV